MLESQKGWLQAALIPLGNHHRSLLRIRNSWDQYSQWKSRYNEKYISKSKIASLDGHPENKDLNDDYGRIDDGKEDIGKYFPE
jgi:hypothetical protein